MTTTVIDTVAGARVSAPPPPASVDRDAAYDVFTPVSAQRSPLRRFIARFNWPLGIYTTPLLILLVWQLASSLGVLSAKVAPAPTAVLAEALYQGEAGTLLVDITASLERAGLGLLLGLAVAIPVGILAGLLRAGEMAFNGVFQILNTIPLLAILPLMVVWFGIDELTKVLLISLGAAIPMYLNLFAAIRGVDKQFLEMARVSGASRATILRRVVLPGALPGFLVGLRFSLAYSVLGLVAAETVNADEGIGHMILIAQTYMRNEGVFLGLVIYAILGLAADQIVRILERSLLRWRDAGAVA
jgi:sulfonate transport system permease protein